MPEYLTSAQVQELAGCGGNPITAAIKRGELPGSRNERGNRWQIPREVAEAWAAAYRDRVKTNHPGLEALKQAKTDGWTINEAAERWGVTTNTVARWMRLAGFKRERGAYFRTERPSSQMPLEMEARVELLIREGMPSNWIAEDCGVSTRAVYDRAGRIEGHKESVKEWFRVWARIRRTPDLFELHSQFAPKSTLDI